MKKYKNKLQKVFPEFKLISKDKGINPKVLVEDKNGVQYYVLAANLIKGKYPSIKSAVNKTECFISLSNKKHNNTYDYSKTNYLKSNDYVIITCKKHGDFKQFPERHLFGNGCPKCVDKNHSQWKWENYCKEKNIKEGYFYVLKCKSEKEEFVKIGVTIDLKKRYPSKTHLPYSYDVLFYYKNKVNEISKIEKTFKENYKKLKYKPLINFNGYTECYGLNLIPIIEDYFDKKKDRI